MCRSCLVTKLVQGKHYEPSLLTWQQIEHCIKMEAADANDFRARVLAKVIAYHHATTTREDKKKIRKRADAAGEEAVDSDDPPGAIWGEDQVTRYNNISVTNHFLGPANLAALRRDPIGEAASHQVPLPFPEGDVLYPQKLVLLTAQERYNLGDPVVVFERAGIEGQIPVHRLDARTAFIVWCVCRTMNVSSTRSNTKTSLTYIIALGKSRYLSYLQRYVEVL